MKSPKNLLLLLFALAAAAGFALAWKEYQELSVLRLTAVDPQERANLQKRVWDAEKHVHELEQQIASGHGGAGAAGASADASPVRGGAASGGLVGNVLDRMNDPEVQRLMTAQIRAQIERRYAKLFAQLNLPADKLEQLKGLLVDRQQSAMDVLASANDQGITDPRDFQKLLDSAQADIDGQIKASIGDDDFSQFQGYQQSLAARGVVNQLQESLRSSAAPLSDAQADQLTQVMAQTRAAGAAAAPGPGNPPAQISDETLAQAQGFLSGPQLQALQQLQQQQQNQQRLRQMILQGSGGGAAAPGGG